MYFKTELYFQTKHGQKRWLFDKKKICHGNIINLDILSKCSSNEDELCLLTQSVKSTLAQKWILAYFT